MLLDRNVYIHVNCNCVSDAVSLGATMPLLSKEISPLQSTIDGETTVAWTRTCTRRQADIMKNGRCESKFAALPFLSRAG